MRGPVSRLKPMLDDRGADEGDLQSARKRELYEQAAALFARHGYRGASMRDIGAALGIYGGSLYHHVRSKEDLFLAVHGQALSQAAERIRQAADAVADPWDRLEAAAIRLLEIQLDPHSITTPMMNDFATAPASLKARLVEQRDSFESLFKSLVADLPLDPAIDRDIFRITLLSLLNSAVVWYKPGRLSPAEIGRRILAIYRRPA